jgi:hypothetical protein
MFLLFGRFLLDKMEDGFSDDMNKISLLSFLPSFSSLSFFRRDNYTRSSSSTTRDDDDDPCAIQSNTTRLRQVLNYMYTRQSFAHLGHQSSINQSVRSLYLFIT